VKIDPKLQYPIAALFIKRVRNQIRVDDFENGLLCNVRIFHAKMCTLKKGFEY
jgi:hypothetical protein